jgi:hypothetical protein
MPPPVAALVWLMAAGFVSVRRMPSASLAVRTLWARGGAARGMTRRRCEGDDEVEEQRMRCLARAMAELGGVSRKMLDLEERRR